MNLIKEFLKNNDGSFVIPILKEIFTPQFLNKYEHLTIFVPIDEVFIRFAKILNMDLTTFIYHPTLHDIILNHIVIEKVSLLPSNIYFTDLKYNTVNSMTIIFDSKTTSISLNEQKTRIPIRKTIIGKVNTFEINNTLQITIYTISGLLFTKEQKEEFNPRTPGPRYIGSYVKEKIVIPESCLKGYEFEKLIGIGAVGSVNKACRYDKNNFGDKKLLTPEQFSPIEQLKPLNNDCMYAVKMENLKSKNDILSFDDEVKITTLFDKYHIGPKFFGSWKCENRIGFIVTELWDGVLPEVSYDILSEPLLEKLNMQIEKIHQLGYIHGDILPKNVLVKYNDNKTEIIDVTLTDFNLTNKIKDWQSDVDYTTKVYDYFKNDQDVNQYFDDNEIFIENVIDNPKLLDYALLHQLGYSIQDEE